MARINVAAGQPIRATHVNNFNRWLTGETLDNTTAFANTSATDYTLTLTNTANSTAPVFKVMGQSTIATFGGSLIDFYQLVKLEGGAADLVQQSVPSASGTGVTRFFTPITIGGLGWYSSTSPAYYGVGISGITNAQVTIGSAFTALVANSSGSGMTFASSILSLAVTAGDTFVATALNAVSRVAKGSAFQEYVMNAGATAAAWASGVLALATTAGQVPYVVGANSVTMAAANATVTTLFHGGTAPSFSALAAADFPAQVITGAAIATGAVTTAALAASAVTQRPGVIRGSTDATTTSAATASIAEMTFTMATAGGDVDYFARMTINCSTTAVVNLRTRVDAGSWVLIGDVSPPSSAGRQTVSGFNRFTGLSVTTHTFELGWETSLGTATSFGGSRSVLATEIKK